MAIDPNSVDRIQAFVEFIQRAKQVDTKLPFISTPTEHGENITATATINGERQESSRKREQAYPSLSKTSSRCFWNAGE